jgi:hypothetical protein
VNKKIHLVFPWLGGSFILGMVFFPLPLFSSSTTVYSTVELPDPLEDVGHSPRGAAMASAYTAAEGLADSLYWNPAGLSTILSPQISMIHQAWYSGFFRENFISAFPIPHTGAFGVGADYTGYGTLQGYDNNGNPTSSYQPSRYSLSIGWGARLIRPLAIGWVATGRLDSQSSDYHPLSGYVSGGILWSGWKPFRVGAFYSFLNSDDSADMGLLKIGGSWYTELYKDSPTLILLDFSLPPHGVYSLQAGMEQNLWDNFYARAGYQWAWDNNDINGLTGLTAGIGLRFEDWGLDYAFIPYGDLGTSQTLGLTYSFPYITPHPPQKTVPAAPRAAFKPADTLLPGDRLVNVEVKVQLPSGSGSQFATAEDPELQYAIKQQVEKVAQHPKDAKAWYNLATLYWKAGKRAFTAQCFEEILQLQPQNQAIKDWLDKNRQERSNTGLGAE